MNDVDNIDSPPVISVIIPSYQSQETIQACLESVLKQSTDVIYEVIVVDSSVDATPLIIRSEFPQVKLLHQVRQTIPSEARNIGIEVASGTYLTFTDADCIVDHHWLEAVLTAHQSGYDVVGGCIFNARPNNIISIAEYFLEFREFSPYSPRRETSMIPTCVLSAHQKVFNQYGVFPDIRASEDRLFMHRLELAGVKALFEPKIIIHHLNRNRFKPFMRNQYILGVSCSVARRLVSSLPGAFLVEHISLALLLPFVRLARTVQFVLMNRFPRNLSDFVKLTYSMPFFLVGLAAWSWGFIKGMKAPLPETDKKLI